MCDLLNAAQFGPKYGGSQSFGVRGIRDDPSLWGQRDMDFGYVFFAVMKSVLHFTDFITISIYCHTTLQGSGPNSRGNQMVVALCEKPGCIQTQLGKAPWEVPVGTIRKEGFEVLKRIGKSGFPYPKLEMAGQAVGAKGPDQHRIATEKDYLTEQYPFIEYWRHCEIEQRGIYISRPF